MSDQYTRPPELPRIRRARGRYVYAENGRRYLDCYLNDGGAILGHRPWRVSTVVKDVLSTGRYAEYPSEYSYRLEKELRRCIPTHPVVWLYQNRDAALHAVAGYLESHSGSAETNGGTPDSGKPDRLQEPIDPARNGGPDPDREPGSLGERLGSKAVAYWRPFLSQDWSVAGILLPVMPFPGRWAGQPVCAKEGVELAASAPVSPVCLAGQLRALQTLTAILDRSSDPISQGDTPAPSGRDSSERGRSRADGSTHGSRSSRVAPGGDAPVVPEAAPRLRCFRSRGPYLTPVCDPGTYSALFYTFLENEIILHPSSSGISIWSAEAGSKDAARFVAVDSLCATRIGI